MNSDVNTQNATELDVVESLNEFNDLASTANVAVEAMINIDRIVSVLKKNNSIDKTTAKMASIAFESTSAMLGLATSNVVPALENFDSHHTSATATTIAVEGFEDFLKKLRDGIIRVFKAISKAITNFFSKLFESLSRNKKKDEEMVEYARSYTVVRKPDEIENDNLLNAFRTTRNKSPTIKDVFTIIHNGEAMLGFYKDTIPMLEKYVDVLMSELDELNEFVRDRSETKEYEKQRCSKAVRVFVKNNFEPLLKTHLVSRGAGTFDGITIYQGPILTHGMAFTISYGIMRLKDDTGPDDGVYSSHCHFSESIGYVMSAHMDCLKPDEIKDLVRDYDKLSDNLSHTKSSSDRLKAKIDQLSDKLEKVSTGVEAITSYASSNKFFDAKQGIIDIMDSIKMFTKLHGFLSTTTVGRINDVIVMTRRLCETATSKLKESSDNS